MNSNFNPCLRLVVKNNYFNEGVFGDFRLIPFSSTEKKLKDYGLVFQQNSKQTTFMAKSGKTTLSEDLDGLGKLAFQFILKDPLFFNYTTLNLPQDGQVYFFQNGLNSNDPLLMHKNQFADNSGLVWYSSKTCNVILPDGSNQIEVKNDKGLTVYQDTVSKVTTYNLNLNHLEDGLYQIWNNGSLIRSQFMSDEELQPTTKGIVVIDCDQVLSQMGENLRLSLDFQAQSAYFEYQIVLSKKRKIQIKQIGISGPNNSDYQGPTQQTIVGNQNAQVFRSKEALVLQSQITESPQMKLVYANEFSVRDKVMERNLPNPSVESLRKFQESGQSDAYLLSTIVYV